MELHERKQAERALRRISRAQWAKLFASPRAGVVEAPIRVARDALIGAGRTRRGAPAKPVRDVLDLLGDRLLSDPGAGRVLRLMILHSLPASRWNALLERYRRQSGVRSGRLHGNMVQAGAGSVVMAGYWHQGSRWARSFCEIAGLPQCFAETRRNVLPEDEDVVSVTPLPPLHDFQLEVYENVRSLLRRRTGTAMLSLPTGAGKTRVVVEALLDHLAESGGRRNVVLWVAQSEELQLQAWECIRQVWQTPPQRDDGASVARRGVLRIVRAWGSRRARDIELGAERTVVIAGIQQLGSWVEKGAEILDRIDAQRLAAVVVDEAHRILAPQHRDVLVRLGLRATHEWRPLASSPPVVGLTATPWRTDEEEDQRLRRFFQHSLLTPRALGPSPIGELQRRRILSRVRSERLDVSGTRPMTAAQLRRYEQYRTLPEEYAAALGSDPRRNALVLDRLLRLADPRRTLVFACSVEHAAILTLALNRALESKVAALVTGRTPRSERYDVIEAFRHGELRFLVNVGVLTTGFDAPKVDVVCLTRPTGSAIAYEQMVGRGLRGPLNGGTRSCLVLDVQDAGLPDSIMSYERVVELWSRGGTEDLPERARRATGDEPRRTKRRSRVHG